MMYQYQYQMNTMQCRTEGCAFFGLPENEGKCTVCAGINFLPCPATEEDVMEIFGLTIDDLPTEVQIETRLSELCHQMSSRPSTFRRLLSLCTAMATNTKSSWPLITCCDNSISVQQACHFIGLGPRLRPTTCRAIMDLVLRTCRDDSYTLIAFQKALVRACIAPWLLERSDDFNVGICYFGVGNGGIVTRRSLESLRDAGSIRSAWNRRSFVQISIPSN